MLSEAFAACRDEIGECLKQADGSFNSDTPALTAFIAYRQWRIGREKLRLDLFDRRLEVLTLAEQFAGKVLSEGYPGAEDFRTIWKAIGAAKLLFEDDVIDYLKYLHEIAAKLRIIRQSAIERGNQTDHKISKKKFQDLILEFTAKSEHLADMFVKYLKYSHIQR